ncbi:LANO_0D08746g1_1 [Lachancea nothofagi CBS 11611]|uniref:LANO_0D08746g1_1 n=1 Tax=Lachancea nothofagi CBS 11611 TaxID=1266666 RepID=A0A1G4JJ16_9SACH|nr:LANO_0D08746g1_1 [Lachancea nothofagi CBS 11611]
MAMGLSKEELLNSLDDLNQEIDDYFELSLEKAKERYRLVRYGPKIKVIDKIAEKNAAVRNWKSGIRTNYSLSESRFRKIWESLQNNPELDLCTVADRLGNIRLFQIQKLGAILENVSLSVNEVTVLEENFQRFRDTLKSMNVREETFRSFLQWQKGLCGEAEIFEQLPKLTWNNYKYQWTGNAFRVCIPTRNLSVYTAYCKFYTKLGVCTNPSCKFVHDPRNVSICKDFLTTGRCRYGQNCRLTHSQGNEYVQPHCKKFTEHNCEYEVGSETQPIGTQPIGTQPHETQPEALTCRYIHSQTMNLQYPLCRQFAHMAFCYRGRYCQFPHLMECPDWRSSGQCFLVHCKYPHRELSEVHPITASAATLPSKTCSLLDIPNEAYLLPPLRKRDPRAAAGSWYGMRSSQQCINVKKTEPATAPRESIHLPLESSSDDESDTSHSSSETYEYSGDELDADFIKL